MTERKRGGKENERNDWWSGGGERDGVLNRRVYSG